MKRKLLLSAIFILAAISLSALSYIAARISSTSFAISTVEKCGGGVSDGSSYIEGPSFVTFNIPGLKRPIRNSDASDIAKALSSFVALDVVDFSDTEIGDEFIEEISKGVRCHEIRISRTRCTERAVFILAKDHSCERIRATGVDISPDVSRQVIELDVEVLK